MVSSSAQLRIPELHQDQSIHLCGTRLHSWHRDHCGFYSHLTDEATDIQTDQAMHTGSSEKKSQEWTCQQCFHHCTLLPPSEGGYHVVFWWMEHGCTCLNEQADDSATKTVVPMGRSVPTWFQMNLRILSFLPANSLTFWDNTFSNTMSHLAHKSNIVIKMC